MNPDEVFCGKQYTSGLYLNTREMTQESGMAKYPKGAESGVCSFEMQDLKPSNSSVCCQEILASSIAPSRPSSLYITMNEDARGSICFMKRKESHITQVDRLAHYCTERASNRLTVFMLLQSYSWKFFSALLHKKFVIKKPK